MANIYNEFRFNYLDKHGLAAQGATTLTPTQLDEIIENTRSRAQYNLKSAVPTPLVDEYPSSLDHPPQRSTHTGKQTRESLIMGLNLT